MANETLDARIAGLTAASQERTERLRQESVDCGFTACWAEFRRVFGPGTTATYFRGRTGQFGRPSSRGVPVCITPKLKRVKRA